MKFSTRSDRRPQVRQESVQETGTIHYVAPSNAATSEAARSSKRQRPRSKSTRFQLYNVSLISAASPGAVRAPPHVQKRKVLIKLISNITPNVKYCYTVGEWLD